MTDFGKKHQKISGVRTDSHAADDVLNRSESWQAISQQIEKYDNIFFYKNSFLFLHVKLLKKQL